MAAFNAEKFIAEAIQSVLDQTFSDFEFIIVNDGSTDRTKEIINSFHDPRIIYIEQQNQGIAIALNTGLKKAKGEYIARFDADDICYPQRLEEQYNFIKKNPSYVIVGSAVDYIDQHGEFIFTYSLPGSTNEEIQASKKKICPFIHSGVLYNKNVVLKKGGYNQYAHSFEDHLLWLEITEDGKAFNLPASLIKVRLNPDSVSIDETWRPKQFHRIKTEVLHKQCITEREGEALLKIIRHQNTKEIKEGAYHALLAKKFLWNNCQPAKARENLKKVISQHRLDWKSYCLFFISFLPPLLLQRSYRLFKAKSLYPANLLKQTRADVRTRIFVDAHCFDTEYQGTRTFIKGIYSFLAQKQNVHLFLGSFDNDNLKKAFPVSSNVTFVQYKSKSTFLRLAIEIPFTVRKYKIHYVHCQYITPFIKNCKHIVTIHDVLFEEYPKEFPAGYRLIRKFLFKRSARKADIVTTVSGYSKKSIQKHFGISSEKIHIIANGIDKSFFQTHDKNEAKEYITEKYGIGKFVLLVSRFEPRKNHHLLLKAFLGLKLYEKSYHLVLPGHQSIKSPVFTNLLASLDEQIRNYIFISEKITDEDLLQFYRAAEVFVYPSIAEGFGIPPLEAAATGIPVICSNTTAMNDYHFFGSDHIDPFDYDTLKGRLANAIEGNHDSADLIAISKKIESDYSWSKSAEKLYGIIINDRRENGFPTTINTPGSIKIKRSTAKHSSFQVVINFLSNKQLPIKIENKFLVIKPKIND